MHVEPEDEEFLSTHEFYSYYWDKTKCGYIDGDDIMCGYPKEAHKEMDKNGRAKYPSIL